MSNRKIVDAGLKPDFQKGAIGTAEQAAEKLKFGTSGAKALTEKKGLIAALKRCATSKSVFFRKLQSQGSPTAVALPFLL